MMAGSGSGVVEASKRLELISDYAFVLLKKIIECLVCVTHCSGYVGGCGRHKSGSGYDSSPEREQWGHPDSNNNNSRLNMLAHEKTAD